MIITIINIINIFIICITVRALEDIITKYYIQENMIDKKTLPLEIQLSELTPQLVPVM